MSNWFNLKNVGLKIRIITMWKLKIYRAGRTDNGVGNALAVFIFFWATHPKVRIIRTAQYIKLRKPVCADKRLVYISVDLKE